MATPSTGVRGRRSASAKQAKELAPGARPLTELAATRLAGVSDVSKDLLIDRSVSELAKLDATFIDPTLLLFRKICGRVVRRDPVSGDDWGVPGATVHVWDTDVNLFASFPQGWPYGWFYPWGWRREQIGSAVTDACGNFCVWVPRFDIDWVLRWRRERHCYFETLRKVSIGDLVERLQPDVEVPPRPGPAPDPGPLAFLSTGVGSVGALSAAVGPKVAAELVAASSGGFGERSVAGEILERPAFPDGLPHPEIEGLDEKVAEGLRRLPKVDRMEIEGRLKERLIGLNWRGPFLPCSDVYVPEFQEIFDVPDISFSVAQDVNGDGVEETIYSEGMFDVRWDAGVIPPVILHAEPFAFATPACPIGPDIPCAGPELVLVGNMPLRNFSGPADYPVIDTATGYAIRPNRPHGSGQAGEIVAATVAAAAPLAGVLEIRGCPHHLLDGTNATHYRILHRVSTNDGASFGPWQPVIDDWNQFRVVGGVLEVRHITTTDGWYEVLDPNDQWLLGDHYLLQWHGPPDGRIELQLELGVAAGSTINVIGGQQAPLRRIVVDNKLPDAAITSLAWRPTGGAWTAIARNCPTIRRNGQDIEIRVGVSASARHLRSVSVGAGGCGSSGGPPALIEGLEDHESGVPTGSHTGDYWHRTPADNAIFDEVTYAVPASSAPGAYSFGVTSWSRAFSPSDGHVYSPGSADVSYVPAPNWRNDWVGVAIVD
jgi:hypothetical protein